MIANFASQVPALALRPATAADRPLLLRIYASTREGELALTDWSDEAKAAFVEQQFTAQHAYYREYYPEAAFDVVLLDGEPIGRLYVQRWPDEIRLIEVALLPEARNRGLGGKLVADLLAEARATGRRVTIHVEIFNPALRLYARLGFRKIADRGPYQLMEWRAAPNEDAPA
jgi:ribosomal protein S18 acetylase RimI-like enzyme